MSARQLVSLIASCGLAAAAHAQNANPLLESESTSLTIYSTAQPGGIPASMYRPVAGTAFPGYDVYGRPMTIPGYAVVRHDRPINLNQGRTQLSFTDVAALLDPTTVTFASLTDPEGTQVIEQSYRFDLVSTEKLMERYLGQRITVEATTGSATQLITGTLLSSAAGLVLQEDSGSILTVSNAAGVRLPKLPEGLITRPTLEWEIQARKAGAHRARVAYQTEGIVWWADYNLTFAEGKDANSGVLDVGAWVSILNKSGATYTDAKLKLVAGDVHRAPQPGSSPRGDAMFRGAEAQADGGFQEKSFFEYHLYTLGRPTTIPDNSTKQIELFPAAREVPAEKVLVYDGLQSQYHYYGVPVTDAGYGRSSNTKVNVFLRFKNDKASGLGVPLPSGRIRVSKLDAADGALEFIGEDSVDHTPKDEQVLIKLGDAFDVVGERVVTDYRLDTSAKTIIESVKITLRNHKEEDARVLVREQLFRWVSWSLTAASHEHEKVNASTIHFPVMVPKDGEVVVTYTVKYAW